MSAWARMVVAVALMLLPGGFIVLFGYVLGRALFSRWRKAQLLANGGPVHVREVLHDIHFRELVAEARHAL